MNTLDELHHAVLQRMIIVFLGLLTLMVFAQSCTYTTPCSAYDNVELDEGQPIE
jgi:hypothetical protein